MVAAEAAACCWNQNHNGRWFNKNVEDVVVGDSVKSWNHPTIVDESNVIWVQWRASDLSGLSTHPQLLVLTQLILTSNGIILFLLMVTNLNAHLNTFSLLRQMENGVETSNRYGIRTFYVEGRWY